MPAQLFHKNPVDVESVLSAVRPETEVMVDCRESGGNEGR